MKIKIERAKQPHYARWASERLTGTAIPSEDYWDDDNWITQVWHAYADDLVAGYGVGAIHKNGSVYYLTSCGVETTFRGKGIQLRLIRARVRAARKLGAMVVETYTTWDNLPSQRNLIRAGFMPIFCERDEKSNFIHWQIDL